MSVPLISTNDVVNAASSVLIPASDVASSVTELESSSTTSTNNPPPTTATATTTALPVPAGGSAWNRGGWHWEARDVSALASAALHDGAAQLSQSGALGANARGGFVHVSVRRVERAKVEAAIQVRRGARAAIFDLSFTCVWEAEWEQQPLGSGRALIARGELEGKNVGPDDVEGPFPLIFRTIKKPNDPSPQMQAAVRAAEGIAQQHVGELVRELLRRLPAFLLLSDAAAAERASKTGTEEAALEVTARGEGRTVDDAVSIKPLPLIGAANAAAHVVTNILPPSLGRAAPLAAAAATLTTDALSVAVALPVASHRAPSAGDAPEATPSSWNRGGWGYEHKDMKAWTHTRLRQVLLGFAVDVAGAHMAIVDVEELVGDADIVLQKVRKRRYFFL